MGMIAPCLLELKLFVQQCWKIKVDSQDPAPPSMDVQFGKLMLEREEIKTILYSCYL